MDQSLFRGGLESLTDIHAFEQIYDEAIPNNETFDIVNRAVWYALHRLIPGALISADSVNGGTCHHITVNNESAQLFVLKMSSTATIVRLILLPPTREEEHKRWMHANHQLAITGLATVFSYCTARIDEMLATTAGLEHYSPSCPPLSTGWPRIFQWQRLYHPDMSNLTLADQLKVGEQHVRNMRRELGYPKRDPQKTRKKGSTK